MESCVYLGPWLNLCFEVWGGGAILRLPAKLELPMWPKMVQKVPNFVIMYKIICLLCNFHLSPNKLRIKTFKSKP